METIGWIIGYIGVGTIVRSRIGSLEYFRVIFPGGGGSMPRLSQFYGIAIYMQYRDHAPPHFHAIYGEHEAVFEIVTGTVIAG